MNADPVVKLADFTSLRIAREDRAAHNNFPHFKGEQLADAMVNALVKSTKNNWLTKYIAARALGKMAVSSVR